MLDEEIQKRLLTAQKSEIAEHIIYKKIASAVADPHNKKILQQISKDELKHYNFWKRYTQRDVKPSQWKIWKYYLISRLFGLTFGIKLMEKGEENAQLTYTEISQTIPEAKAIIREESSHENQLIGLINEERLKYVGSIVLGLNDALVELTAALAGFTLALQNTRTIALVGLITGIAASFSMAASEYLSTKAEKSERNPLKASAYTGFVYVLTVLFLIFPYFIFTNYFLCLGMVLLIAIFVIGLFTFYISVAQEIPFKKRFIEMVSISLGIVALSFGVGFLARVIFEIP